METKARNNISISLYSGGVEITFPDWMIRNLTRPGDRTILANRYARNNSQVFVSSKLTDELIIELLEPYGAWTESEMSKWHTIRLRSTLLWVAAGIAKEEKTLSGYVGD